MTMRTQDAIEHFKSRRALAGALGIAPESTYGWGEFVPPLRQLQLEMLTSGALQAEPKYKPGPQPQ